MRNRGERTVAQVADDLGVPTNQLHRWASTLDARDVAKSNDQFVRNHVFPTRDAARTDVLEHIEVFYNVTDQRSRDARGCETCVERELSRASS
jgi:hypothetical protein